MSIDTSIDEINIKDLTLPNSLKKSGEKPYRFDPDIEITEDNLTAILREINSYKYRGDWGNFALTAASLVIISPERRGLLSLDDELRESILETVKNEPETKEDNFLNSTVRGKAAMLQILYPEARIAEELGWSQDLVVNAIMQGLDFDPPQISSKISLEALLLFPQMQDKLKSIDKLEEALRSDVKDVLGLYYDNSAVTLKILFPESSKTFIDSKMPGLKSSYEDERGEWSWFHRLSMGAELTLLSADELKITDKGIKIINTQPESDLENDINPIPEKRRF